jgi:hypothetical protein
MNKILSDNINASVFTGIITLMSLFIASPVFAGTLSCSVTTAAACTGGTNTIILRMSGSTNAHAELASGSTYNSSVVCCSGITGLGTSCSTGVNTSLLWLAGATNAHSSQLQTNGNYTNNACISVPTGGAISVGYQATNCTGYDTTIASMSGSTNAHIGNGTQYSTKICATGAATIPLPVQGTLTSSVFDTTANSTSIGYNSIMWKGTAGTGKVSFQLGAASAITGPWNYYGGSTCGALDWFDTTGPNAPVELKGATCLSNWNNKRYFRYKVKVCSSTDCSSIGTVSPIIDDIIVNWSS